MSFPGGASGKEPTCQCSGHKRCGFDPWVGPSTVTLDYGSTISWGPESSVSNWQMGKRVEKVCPLFNHLFTWPHLNEDCLGWAAVSQTQDCTAGTV